MKQSDYDKLLIKWIKNHYWDSLEKDKDLILRHLRTFAGDINAIPTSVTHSDSEGRCECQHNEISYKVGSDYCQSCGKLLRAACINYSRIR